MPTSFRALGKLCEEIEATNKRLAMIDLVADFLSSLDLQEVEPAVSLILGRHFPKWSQRTLDLNWGMLRDVIKRITGADWQVFTDALSKTEDVGAATKVIFENSRVRKQSALFERTLTVIEVKRSLEAIAETRGTGSREKKERLVEVMFSLASPLEAKYLVKILVGEMRTGLHEGLMEQAISKAFQIPIEMVRRASMIIGDIGEVATKAKAEGKDGLSKIGFRVFRPVELMLAQIADGVAEALKEHDGKSAFEFKYDGARVQIHKLDDEVKVFSRRLTDVTESLPEIVQVVRKNVKAREAILEGEVIAVSDSGHPIPFQHLMRRFRRVHGIEDAAEKIPVTLYLFDILYLNGENFIDVPYLQRRQTLAENAGRIALAGQIVTSSVKEAEQFLKEAMDAGHEGLMEKKLDSSYIPGIRGKNWFKVKPILEPLDLVIVSAEYGYGRRHGWLSDYCLAARDDETGVFLSLGKTFKGLTDAEIMGMTKRLRELALKVEHGRVVVVPTIVVEVAYNEIQKSPKYECGMTLRFARITRIREDKSPEQADTIQRVKEIYERQFLKKGRYKT